MATYRELLAQRNALDEQMAEARQAEVGAAIAQIRELMTQYELTVDDLAPRRRGRPKGAAAEKSTVAPKYLDPKTGATWSGRGRAPAWIAGKKRDRFLIAE